LQPTRHAVWLGREFRPTRDIDFLGAVREDHTTIRRAIQAICAMPCPEDGLAFDPETIQIEDIRDQQEHGGVRVRLRGHLGQAQLSLQADIGFGDVVTPDREVADYPTLLDHPAPRIWVYPRETFVAEKFEATVRLGPANSRVRDLWDLTALAQRFRFDGEILRTAITRPSAGAARHSPQSFPRRFARPTIKTRRGPALAGLRGERRRRH